MPRTEDVRVRDLFIYVDRPNQRYLLLASVDNRAGKVRAGV